MNQQHSDMEKQNQMILLQLTPNISVIYFTILYLFNLVLKESNEAVSDDDNSWYYSFPQDSSSTFNIPFVPGYKQHDDGMPGPYDGNFDYMTISLNATLPSIKETVYNVHSLYGLMMSKTT